MCLEFFCGIAFTGTLTHNMYCKNESL